MPRRLPAHGRGLQLRHEAGVQGRAGLSLQDATTLGQPNYDVNARNEAFSLQLLNACFSYLMIVDILPCLCFLFL